MSLQHFRQHGSPDHPIQPGGGVAHCGGDRFNNHFWIRRISSHIKGHQFTGDVTIRNGNDARRHTVPRCNARFRGSWAERFVSRVRVQFAVIPGHGFNNNILNTHVWTRQYEMVNQHFRTWRYGHLTNWWRYPRQQRIPNSPNKQRRWPRNSFVINSEQLSDIAGRYRVDFHNTINFLGARRVQIRFNLPNNNDLQPLRQLNMRYFRDNYSFHFGDNLIDNFTETRTNYVYDDDAQIATGQGLWHFVHHDNLPRNYFQESSKKSNTQLKGLSRISHNGFNIPRQTSQALNHALDEEQPTHTWLTYLLAPKAGHYAFSYLNAGNTRNINDEFQFYKISTSAEEAGEKASLIESFPVQLKKDEIVLAYGKYKKSIQPLAWQISKQNKANGNDMNNFSEVPASAMFLSADAALLSKGINEINDEGSDNTATFQIYSTREPTGDSFNPRLSEILNLAQPSNTQSAFNSDELTAHAHDGSGSTHLFHDYRINGRERVRFEPMQLETNEIKLPTNLYAANFEVKTLQDLYAEKNPSDSSATYESIRMSLNTGFFQRHNMLHSMPGNHDWDIPIIDSAPIVSLSHSG